MAQKSVSHIKKEYPKNAEWLIHDNPHILFAELARKQGPVVPLFGKRKLFAINGLETITEVLKEQANKLRRPTLEPLQTGRTIKIVEAKDGRPHEEQRRLMLKIINDFVMSRIPDIETHVRRAADFIIEEIATGQPIDPDIPVGAGILSYTYRMNFGESLTKEAAIEMISGIGSLSFSKNGNGMRFQFFREELMPSDWFYPSFEEFNVFKQNSGLFERNMKAFMGKIEEQIIEHKRSFDSNHLRDITDALIKANDEYKSELPIDTRLDEEDIILGSMVHLFGVTRGLLIVFTIHALHYMAVYQEIQSTIQKELDEAMARGIQPGFSSRHEIPFTEACLWEILRHASVAALASFGYEAREDIMAAGRKLDKGAILLINYYSTTRDERHWPDPESFNPRRFLDAEGRVDRSRTDKFLPFGIGHHRCLGGPNWGYVNMMTLFPTLLARCRFERTLSTPDKLEQHPGPFLTPHNYELIATRRP
uniref:Cytochrome P450 n=1 Tax=Candidatus Kentrum sp. FW TaxID=2126338 RepID=A0A450TW58_9GAMM|nr:MAG: Cytochrome P450 [Candidatus Kentron sp. FW]